MTDYTIESGKITCHSQTIPIVWQGDVLVLGGGPGGLGAAISAHRLGAKVLLIEELGFLGGMCSYGCGMPIGGAHPAYISNGGIAEEIQNMTINAGQDAADIRIKGQFSFWYFHDSEYFKSMIAELVLNEKLPVRLHTTFSDVIKDRDGHIIGVVAESKSGREALLAKTFIDATGDADAVARTGGEYVKGRPSDGAMMAGTLVFTAADVDVERFLQYKAKDPLFLIARKRAAINGDPIHRDEELPYLIPGMRPGTLHCNTVHIRGMDGTDTQSLSDAELQSYVRVHQIIQFFRKYIPGCEKCYASVIGARIGVRETRRIIGEDILTTEDTLSYRKRKNVIMRSAGPQDDAARGDDRAVFGEKTKLNENEWYDIAYGCIVPKGLDNIIVAGRSFSADHLAHSGARGIGLMMCMGQAAGTAATLVSRTNIPFRDLYVPDLQKSLIEQGCYLGDLNDEEHRKAT